MSNSPFNLAGASVEEPFKQNDMTQPGIQDNVNFELEQQDDAENKNQIENIQKIPPQMQAYGYMQQQNAAPYQNQLVQYPYPYANQFPYQYLTFPNPNNGMYNTPNGIPGSSPFSYDSMVPTNSESSATIMNKLPKKDAAHKNKNKNSSKKPLKESNRGLSAHSSSKLKSEGIAQKPKSQDDSNRDRNSSTKPSNRMPSGMMIPSPQYPVGPIDEAAHFNYINTYNPNPNIFFLSNFNGGNGYSSQFTQLTGQPNQFNLYSSLVNSQTSNHIPHSHVPVGAQNTLAYPYAIPYKGYDASFPFNGYVSNKFNRDLITSDTNSKLSDIENDHGDRPKKEIVHVRGYKRKYN